MFLSKKIKKALRGDAALSPLLLDRLKLGLQKGLDALAATRQDGGNIDIFEHFRASSILLFIEQFGAV